MGLSLTTLDTARLQSASEVLLSRPRFPDHSSWCVEALRRLEELFQADRSLFILPTRDGVHVASESIPDPMFGQFREAFGGMSEGRLVSDREDVDAVLEARRAMAMDVFTNDTLLQSTAGSPESVPWYHDVILPSGVRYGSGLAVSLPVGGAWLCVAHSRPDADPFGIEAGLDLLRILLPSFRAGVEIALSMEDALREGEGSGAPAATPRFSGLPSEEELVARYSLTRREAQVTLLLASGASNAAAAASLGISPHTVRTHAERIFRKLGIRTRKGLGLRLLSGTDTG